MDGLGFGWEVVVLNCFGLTYGLVWFFRLLSLADFGWVRLGFVSVLLICYLFGLFVTWFGVF